MNMHPYLTTLVVESFETIEESVDQLYPSLFHHVVSSEELKTEELLTLWIYLAHLSLEHE